MFDFDKIAKMFFEGLSKILLVLIVVFSLAMVIAQVVLYLQRV